MTEADYADLAASRNAEDEAFHAAMRRRVRGRDDCCCGDPNCHDFEDRMAAWGIPLNELTSVEFTVPLAPAPREKETHASE